MDKYLGTLSSSFSKYQKGLGAPTKDNIYLINNLIIILIIMNIDHADEY